ncbi:MAG: protein-L-isoaspartate O-methyltransferase [Halobacteriales archaeon]
MDLATLRDDMVEGLAHPAKGALESEAVSVAMRSVPRHEFVDADAPETAYEDRAFDHGGSTVLAPSTAARLIEALSPGEGDSVLVVGAGVGYTSAVIAEIAGPASVNAIDLSRDLVLAARANLERAGYGAVLVDRRDGAEGLPEYAPYDRILVEAAAVEAPPRLLDQLADGGRLVLPRGANDQSLVAVENGAVAERFGPIRLKPLLVEGEQVGGIERNRAAREERERARQSVGRDWERDWIDWDERL